MMKILTAIVLCNLIVLSNVYADAVKPVSGPPEPLTTSTNNLTTTIKPSTTTPQPTTTTVTPPTTNATTTPKPPVPTTTPKPPITTARTTTTSTEPPVTTTTASPSTTPAPKPKQGTWQVDNSTANSTCILLKMAATIVANYTNKSDQIQEGQLIIPFDANATGVCGETEQNITLSWNIDANITDRIEFIFKKNGSKFELDSIKISAIMDSKYFPNAKEPNALLNLTRVKDDFMTPLKMSYKCTKLQTLSIMNSTNVEVGSIKISDLQVEAFGTITNQKFSDAKDCEPFETPDIVPIAVGCALMALIIVVLIGYLIGRKRNQARGYLSM